MNGLIHPYRGFDICWIYFFDSFNLLFQSRTVSVLNLCKIIASFIVNSQRIPSSQYTGYPVIIKPSVFVFLHRINRYFSNYPIIQWLNSFGPSFHDGKLCPVDLTVFYPTLWSFCFQATCKENWKITGELDRWIIFRWSAEDAWWVKGSLVWSTPLVRAGLIYDLFINEDHGDLDLEPICQWLKDPIQGSISREIWSAIVWPSGSAKVSTMSWYRRHLWKMELMLNHGPKGYEGVAPLVSMYPNSRTMATNQDLFQSPRFWCSRKKISNAKFHIDHFKWSHHPWECRSNRAYLRSCNERRSGPRPTAIPGGSWSCSIQTYIHMGKYTG